MWSLESYCYYYNYYWPNLGTGEKKKRKKKKKEEDEGAWKHAGFVEKSTFSFHPVYLVEVLYFSY